MYPMIPAFFTQQSMVWPSEAMLGSHYPKKTLIMLGVVFAVRDPHRLPEQMAIHFQFWSYARGNEHLQDSTVSRDCRWWFPNRSQWERQTKRQPAGLGCLRDRVGVYLAFLTPSIFQSTNAENGVHCKLKLLLLPLSCSPPIAAVCPPNAWSNVQN